MTRLGFIQMPRRSRAALALLSVMLALCLQSVSAYREAKLRLNDRHLTKLVDGLLFTKAATGLTLTLSDVGVFGFPGRNDTPRYEEFGFFIVPAGTYLNPYSHCILEEVNSLALLRDSSIQSVINGQSKEVTLHFNLMVEGKYDVYFANCAAPTFAVWMDVRLESEWEQHIACKYSDSCELRCSNAQVIKCLLKSPAGEAAKVAVMVVALVVVVVVLVLVALHSVKRVSLQASPAYEALPTAEPFPPVVVIRMAKGGPPAAVQAAGTKVAAGKEGVEGAPLVLAA